MPVNSNILDWFPIPKELIPTNGAGFTLWTVTLIALFLIGQWTWKALDADFTDRFKALFATWPRRIFFVAWLVFAIDAALSQSPWMFATAVVVAPLIALWRIYRRLPLWVATVVSVTAMAGWCGYNRLQSAKALGAKHVYFVLGFEDDSGSRVDEDIIASWNACRKVLQGVFKGIPGVKVMPESSDYASYLWSETKAERNLRKILDGGRPYRLLRAAALITDRDGSRVITVAPELECLTSDDQDLVSVGEERLQVTSRHEDIKHMSLAIASWLVLRLESHDNKFFAKGDTSTANQRILEEYRDFLEMQHENTLLAKVNEALESSSFSNTDVQNLLREYKRVNVETLAGRLEETRNRMLAVSGLTR
jgi:hypothetical protein